MKWLDRLALAGIVLGIGLILFPSKGGGLFKIGFFVTTGATVLHMITSHFAFSRPTE